MRIGKNICQYCTRQRAITNLLLNNCSNQMWQELSYLEMHTNLVEATTASTTLICLYFCLHISIQMFFYSGHLFCTQ